MPRKRKVKPASSNQSPRRRVSKRGIAVGAGTLIGAGIGGVKGYKARPKNFKATIAAGEISKKYYTAKDREQTATTLEKAGKDIGDIYVKHGLARPEIGFEIGREGKELFFRFKTSINPNSPEMMKELAALNGKLRKKVLGVYNTALHKAEVGTVRKSTTQGATYGAVAGGATIGTALIGVAMLRGMQKTLVNFKVKRRARRAQKEEEKFKRLNQAVNEESKRGKAEEKRKREVKKAEERRREAENRTNARSGLPPRATEVRRERESSTQVPKLPREDAYQHNIRRALEIEGLKWSQIWVGELENRARRTGIKPRDEAGMIKLIREMVREKRKLGRMKGEKRNK